MVTSRHLATMARPAGRAKKFFESWQEERAEASRDLVERANGRMLYAEVLTWTFPTAAAGQRLVDAAKMCALQRCMALGGALTLPHAGSCRTMRRPRRTSASSGCPTTAPIPPGTWWATFAT